MDTQSLLTSEPGVVDFSPMLQRTFFHVPRKEIVKPYLHWLDERALKRGVDDFFSDFANLDYTVKKICKDKKIPVGKIDDLVKLIFDTYKGGKFPISFVNDLFNFYYYQINTLEFEHQNETNRIIFKMLERLNHPTMRVLIQENPVKTMILVRTLALNFLFGYAWRKLNNQDSEDILEKLEESHQNSKLQSPQSFAGGQLNGIQISGPEERLPPESGQKAPDKKGSANGNQQSPDKPVPYAQDTSNSKGPDSSIQSVIDQSSSPVNGLPDSESGTQMTENQAATSMSGGGGGSSVNANAPISDYFEQNDQIIDDWLNAVIDNQVATQFSQQSLKDLRRMFTTMDNTFENQELDECWKNFANDEMVDAQELLDRLEPSLLNKIHQELKSLRLNMSGVKSSIKHLLDKSVNYFSSKQEVTHVSLWDADNIEDFVDFQFLHPQLRRFFLEDLTVKQKKKVGKIDMYVDISTSMNDSCGAINDKGETLTKKKFAKAVSLKLKELDLMDDFYTFNNSVQKIKNSIIDILTIRIKGGTNITNLVRHINKTGKNSLVITDAEDGCKVYSPYVYFLGIAGSNFSHFRPEILEKYVRSNQLCIYDGENIYSVGFDGRPIGD